VTGSLQTPAGLVPRVSSSLTWADHWGTIKARWGVGRMHYMVDPGLYALGNPYDQSPILITANYKMSFDRLREALTGRDAWILVLDTKGINVWCAAGKGTFGAEELTRQVENSALAKIVTHSKLILPQLAGPGVAAHKVNKLSGFQAIYGPIQAKDLPTFIDRGFKATPEMRRKAFPLWERAVLIPMELVGAMKAALIVIPLFFLISGLAGSAGFWVNALDHGLFAVIALLGALAAGAIFTPILLPWLPGRAFSLKGLTAGLITAVILLVFRAVCQTGDLNHWMGRFEALAWLFMVPAVAAYLAMNFTGSSTYTSLSGVKKEMKWAVPLEIGAAFVGICLWLGSRFMI